MIAALERGINIGREPCCDMRYFWRRGESDIYHYADTPEALLEDVRKNLA